MSTVDIAAAAAGGRWRARPPGVDPDRLLVSGNALATGLDRMLEILADVLDRRDLPGRRGRDRAGPAGRPDPGGAEPARAPGPGGAAASGCTAPPVRGADARASRGQRGAAGGSCARCTRDRVHPDGATLVLVGDIDPERGARRGRGGARRLERRRRDGRAAADAGAEPGPLLLVDRPGSVQSSLRMALPAVARTHPDHAALQLANLIFGGYFSSRWVENIREDKGYTYGPHSLIEHSIAGSALILSAEVATEVTAPGAAGDAGTSSAGSPRCRPSEDELEQARQYALGSLLLGMSTQAGLAGLASTYAGYGLRLDYLAEHAARLAAATRDEVAAAAASTSRPPRRSPWCSATPSGRGVAGALARSSVTTRPADDRHAGDRG